MSQKPNDLHNYFVEITKQYLADYYSAQRPLPHIVSEYSKDKNETHLRLTCSSEDKDRQVEINIWVSGAVRLVNCDKTPTQPYTVKLEGYRMESTPMSGDTRDDQPTHRYESAARFYLKDMPFLPLPRPVLK